MSETKNRELTLAVTALIFAAFAVVDYFSSRFGPNNSVWLFAFTAGACVAQVTLIAAWAVFAPGNLVIRLPWALLFGLMMWYVLIAGMRHGGNGWGSVSANDELVLGVILLAAVAVLQVPLWTAKRTFHYRLIKPGESPRPLAEELFQFQLRDLLVGTFVFALALSPIRLVLPKESIGSLGLSGNWPVLVPAALVVNLVATVPCLWGGFIDERRFWTVVGAWLVYVFIVSAIALAVLGKILGPPGEREIEVICAFNFSQGAVILAVTRLYYALGFRLQRVPRLAPPTAEQQPTEPEAG